MRVRRFIRKPLIYDLYWSIVYFFVPIEYEQLNMLSAELQQEYKDIL